MKKLYQVKLHLFGGMGYPSYDCGVKVWANDDAEAGREAREKLARGDFRDRPFQAREARVDSVEAL